MLSLIATRRLQAAIFALLAGNTIYYILAGRFSEALESVAWYALLILFLFEASRARQSLVPGALLLIHGLRLLATFAILTSAVLYVREQEWLDATNLLLWIAVVVLLEFEIQRPATVAAHRSAFALSAALLYAALGQIGRQRGGDLAHVGHGLVDVGIGRLRLLLEQRGGGHDLAGLAVAALGDVKVDPSLLQRMQAIALGQAFDGHNLLPVGCRHRVGARPHRLAVQVDRARATLPLAAAILRTGELQVFAQNPQQRRIGMGTDIVPDPVHTQRGFDRLCHIA